MLIREVVEASGIKLEPFTPKDESDGKWKDDIRPQTAEYVHGPIKTVGQYPLEQNASCDNGPLFFGTNVIFLKTTLMFFDISDEGDVLLQLS